MSTFIKDFLEYNQQANLQFIRSFQVDGFADERGIKLFSHILNAHHIWLSRVRDVSATFAVWDIHITNSFTQLNKQNFTDSIQLLNEEPDLSRVISYNNTKGASFKNSIQDIILHVVNHSSYHRGQIASIIWEKGFTPPVSDFIYYKRDAL